MTKMANEFCLVESAHVFGLIGPNDKQVQCLNYEGLINVAQENGKFSTEEYRTVFSWSEMFKVGNIYFCLNIFIWL